MGPAAGDRHRRLVLSRKIKALRDNKARRAKLVQDLTLAEMELRDASAEQVEIDAVLEFADAVLLNALNLWKTAPTPQKQRLQQVLFPKGVTYSEGSYRTDVTCMLFNGMRTERTEKEGLVALPGIE